MFNNKHLETTEERIINALRTAENLVDAIEDEDIGQMMPCDYSGWCAGTACPNYWKCQGLVEQPRINEHITELLVAEVLREMGLDGIIEEQALELDREEAYLDIAESFNREYDICKEEEFY